MKKSILTIFSGREMYRLLIRNDANRVVSREDLKHNEYFSPASLKKSERRIKELIKSIQKNGWKNQDVRAYRMEDGRYVLLNGNHRRKSLDICVERGILPDYPAWNVIDMSLMINPNTGKYYTFEEAQYEVEFGNIHSEASHTGTDIIEVRAGQGSAMCREICRIAKKHEMSTTLVGDLMSGIQGSSREDCIERLVKMDLDNERMADVEKILDVAASLDNCEIEGAKSFKEYHCVHGIAKVYYLSKSCGVADDYCEFMKLAGTVRRPNPFLNFFEKKQTNVYIDQILYIIDGVLNNVANKRLRALMEKIQKAFNECGVTAGISKFHSDIKFGRKGANLDTFVKMAA